jgi:hypothetical protein
MQYRSVAPWILMGIAVRRCDFLTDRHYLQRCAGLSFQIGFDYEAPSLSQQEIVPIWLRRKNELPGRRNMSAP